jgi:hypothetical protein
MFMSDFTNSILLIYEFTNPLLDLDLIELIRTAREKNHLFLIFSLTENVVEDMAESLVTE